MASRTPFLLLCFSILLQAPLLCTATSRNLLALVKDPPLVLDYHDGELLAGPGSLNVYAIWYGDFSPSDKSTVSDFFTSFNENAPKSPSVASWWKVTSGYKDTSGASIFPSLNLAAQLSIPAAANTHLTSSDLESLLSKSISSSQFPSDPKALYLILTAKDVGVEGFCVQSCASHRVLKTSDNHHQLVYAWIGDSSTQCPGKCAWPYANAKDFGGPDTPGLIAPNGVGVDGMVINIATMVAGASSNPFGSGYFQGPSSAPLEAVTACPGMFGQGAYSGYPGELLTDAKTGASFNAFGSNSRRFLLPALWNPATSTCTYPST